MKITQNRPLAAPGRRRDVERAQTGTDRGLAAHVAAKPATSEPAALAPLAALGSILTVQEVDDAGAGRRQAVDRGRQLLDELHELRLALIDGWLPEESLHRLAAAVEQAGPDVNERELAAVLEDIEVRAAVELAKLQRRPS